MRRQVLLFLAVLMSLPAIAQATVTITLGNHILEQNKADQTFNITITADEDYAFGDTRTTIEASGPFITKINGTTDGAIASMAGTVWAGGGGGIAGTPNGTPTIGDNGRFLTWSHNTSSFAVQQTDGIHAIVTVSTVGIAAGVYDFTDGNDGGISEMFSAIVSDEGVAVSELIVEAGTLTVTPEPGTIVLGLFAAAGLASVAIRRHRSRRAA
jgi:hypothetical protein